MGKNMGKKNPAAVLAFVAAFIVSSSLAGAVGIDFYGIDIDVHDAISEKLTVTFDSQIEGFRLPIGRLNAPLRIQKISANKGAADCKPVVEEGKTSIDCRIIGPPAGRNTLTFFLEPLDGVDLAGNKSIVDISYEFPFDTKSLSVSYNLPERAALSEDPPEKSISPRNGDIKTDGKKIFIFWNRQNITAGDIMTFSVSYTLPEQSPLNALLILPIIFMLAAFAWFVIKHKNSAKEVDAAVSVLSKEEKVLFDILKAHDGKANQKILVRQSNFSKAKVSRLLKGLKERGVIEIEPVSGRENRILLRLGQNKEKEKSQQAKQPKQPAAQETKENEGTQT